MNLLDMLVRRVGVAGDRSCGALQRPGPLNLAADVLIGVPAGTAIQSLQLVRSALSGLPPSAGGRRRVRVCAHCGAPVSSADPFIRYRGEYYHAHLCAEAHPPAECQRRGSAQPVA
jgi:hypothetical protein